MTVFVTLETKGTSRTDALRINVTKSIGENNGSSRFNAEFTNIGGRHKTDFAVGDEVTIKADKDVNPATTDLFVGLIESISFDGEGTEETVVIEGRDFTQRLMDATVEPSVFTDDEVSTIVTNIMASFVDDVTTTNVEVTSTTLDRITFLQKNAFDSIKQLAELSNSYFFVDTNKDLNFKVKGGVSSGITLDNVTVTRADFVTSDEDMANEVFVYGDRYLVAQQDTFTADGGSVFTLDFNPHNTQVDVNGTLLRGGILNLTAELGSNDQYLVAFHEKQIIVTSGVAPGDNVPGSLDPVTIDYFRDRPVIKVGRDLSSISAFGPKDKVIVDKDIKDPDQATELVKNQLALFAAPLVQGTLKLQDVTVLTPSETLVVNLPNFNINNEVFEIIEAVYEFNIDNNQRDEVLTVKVSRKIKNVIDELKQIKLDIKKIQAGDINTSDTITRLESAVVSGGFRVSNWNIHTRTVGSSFLLDDPVLGRLGSVDGTQPLLGDFRGGSVFVTSGGDI